MKKFRFIYRPIHIFDNGVKVYDDHLLQSQKARYTSINLHEPEEEKMFTRVISDIRENGVFVNVGSAIGYYCLLARKLRPDIEIYAFNPHPAFREKMCQNMVLNNINDIHMIHEAIYDKDDKTMFIGNGYGDGIEKK